jgi:preprotein translocase subunit SecG
MHTMDWNMIIQYALLVICFIAIIIYLVKKIFMRKKGGNGCNCGCGGNTRNCCKQK